MSLPPVPKIKHSEPFTIANSKRILRRSLLEIRSKLSINERRHYDELIGKHILQYLKLHPLISLGVYLPIRNEPDLSELYIALSDNKIQLSLPIVTGKNQALQFVRWNPGEALVEGAYGISIPEILLPVKIPEALLIPCVGYNLERFRLGYGGGFFDRTLILHPETQTIGIAYSCLARVFETEENDIPLACIITENGMVP